MAALALALSASLWLLISVEQNPPKVDIFTHSIPVDPVNVPRGLDVLGDVPPTLIRISAPQDAWDQLDSSSFKASADLSQATSGTYEAPVHVESNDWRIRVVDVIPAKVTVRLVEVTQQTVAAKINVIGGPPPGYTTGAQKITPEKVTVIGPEPLVSQVDAVVADVNLSTTTVNVNQSFKLKPRTARGYEIEGVTIEPSSAVVEIPVTQQVIYRSFSISAQVKGDVASGYWVSGISVQPAAVTVMGAREALQSVAYLETQPVDVSNLTNNISRRVSLSLPKGVSIVGADTVIVYVSISAIEGSRVITVSPDYSGLPPNLTIVSSLSAVNVTLTGELPSLRNLKATDITIAADLSNLGPGLHELEPKVTIPKGTTVAKLDPERVWVILR